jgi:A/G-specific adenine glycosylase
MAEKTRRSEPEPRVDKGIETDAFWVADVRERLMNWYEAARRDLPWRANRDPYRILVSEMMLVQTTVAAVIPFFERFLLRFPDIQALAEADESDVLKAWEGLGYYRRARQLQAAARQVVRDHGGKIPDDPSAILNLPGVGKYIAGAVSSFAFDRPEPIVEANSQRVLARLLAETGSLKSKAVMNRIWGAAARLVPRHGAGNFNQSLMEVGALVCTPRRPSCLVCPLAPLCEARRLGLQDELPIIPPKPPALLVSEACVVLLCDDQVLIIQRAEAGLWEQFWEFPTIHLSGADPAARSFGTAVELPVGVQRLTGINAQVGPAVHTFRFGVTNHKVTMEVHLGRALSGTLKAAPGFGEARWVHPNDLRTYTFGSASRRVIAWLEKNVTLLESAIATH